MLVLPGIEQMNPWTFIFNKGIPDADIQLMGQFSKEVVRARQRDPHDIFKIERYLNQLEKTQSLFDEPVGDIGEENISINNNTKEDERIPIPDAEFSFHKQIEGGFEDGDGFEHTEQTVIIRSEEEIERAQGQEIDGQRFEPFQEVVII